MSDDRDLHSKLLALDDEYSTQLSSFYSGVKNQS